MGVAGFVLETTSLSAIESGRGRVGVDRSLEAGHIDRWAEICRIVQHSVMNGVEAGKQIAVRDVSHSQCWLDNVQFCFWHCCPFSEVLETVPAAFTRRSLAISLHLQQCREMSIERECRGKNYQCIRVFG